MGKETDRTDLNACVQYLNIAMSRVKLQEHAHVRKPNPEFHELADALAPFPEDDHASAFAEARRITRFSVFEGRVTWTEGKFKGYLQSIPEGCSLLVPSGLLPRVENFLVTTTLAGYSGPRFRLHTPHSGVGVLRRKTSEET